MKRLPVTITLAAALVSLAIGATQPVAVVPLAGSVRITGLSWGGELRTVVLAIWLVGAIGFSLLRRPGWACLAASIAFGILVNMGMSAHQWYSEKMTMLTSSGLLGKGTTLGVDWKWPAGFWALSLALTAAAAIHLAILTERRAAQLSRDF